MLSACGVHKTINGTLDQTHENVWEAPKRETREDESIA